MEWKIVSFSLSSFFNGMPCSLSSLLPCRNWMDKRPICPIFLSSSEVLRLKREIFIAAEGHVSTAGVWFGRGEAVCPLSIPRMLPVSSPSRAVFLALSWRRPNFYHRALVLPLPCARSSLTTLILLAVSIWKSPYFCQALKLPKHSFQCHTCRVDSVQYARSNYHAHFTRREKMGRPLVFG